MSDGGHSRVGSRMKAIFHGDNREEEEVEILDIFVDRGGEPKIRFTGADGRIATAPINRFTNFENVGHMPDWFHGHE